jgi:hypothetical protein
LVIGKSARPRCFRTSSGGDLALPVKCAFNKRAWMTTNLFEEHVVKPLNTYMVRKKERAVLFCDNASSHNIDQSKYCNVEIVMPPHNTTALTQPLDQGIIQNFKVNYRRIMMDKVLSILSDDIVNHTDNGVDTLTASELVRSISVLDAVEWSATAWNNVKLTTISNCFTKAYTNNSANLLEHYSSQIMLSADDLPVGMTVV